MFTRLETQIMTKERPWISLSEAGRRIGTSNHVIRRLVDRGTLSVLELPGTHPRVAAAELDRLARENTRPAHEAS
jgi:excisionase family DNA binding protein